MTVPDRSSADPRILILAPTRRDAELTHGILNHARLGSEYCRDLSQVLERLEAGVDALMLPEEALAEDEQGLLQSWLGRQPPWSDLPILIIARPGTDSATVTRGMAQLGNVTVLERPIRAASMVSAVGAALRARRRQYDARDYLARIERSEGELREFFDNAVVGIQWLGPDGIILRVNQAELDLLGYDREQVVGRPVADLHVDPAEISDVLRRVQAGEILRDVEAGLRCRDGTTRHVLVNASGHWDEGRFAHAQLFTRDVTDRKAVLETQARLAAIVESSHDAIISKNLDGVILTWNRGAERLFGYTADEMIGRPVTMLIPPDRDDEEPRLLARLRRGEGVDHFETVRVAKNGSRLDISLTLSPVRTADGTIIGVSKVARDISHAKRAETALRTVQQQLQVVTDHMAVVVTHCGRDLRYRWVSPGMVAWLGLPVEELIGRPIVEVIGGTAFEVVRPDIERVLQGEPVEFEKLVPYHGLGPRWIKASCVPTRDGDGQVDGWVDAITDVTARHEMEQALLEADHRKDEFLAMLAHELRNPLAPIRNALHILRMTSQLDAASLRVTDLIERQVNHLVRLVDDLLEVSRITRGRIELRKERTDLATVVRSAVETSRPSIDASGHELDILLPPEPLVVNGDAVRLTQVLANLLNNAAKYTDPGGRISLEVARDGEVAVMTVRDTGIGIAPGMLGRVFDLFVQTDPHDGRSQGGLGLGLALVRRLVEMHGGTVHAASEGPGRGSEFMVRMPLAAAGDEDPVEERPPGMSPDVAAQRVLIVDDNRDAAQSLGMLLKLLGVEVHVTFSGLEAIEALPLYRPDVVLLDLGMPVMDGVEVARRIRQHPDFHGVTLIALTGWGQATDRDRVREAGFDYHLIKPADIAALTAVLENAPRNGRQPASRMAAGELSPPETEGTRAARPATGDARDTD